MATAFDRITSSAAAARDQFSVPGKPEDNAEVIKELAAELIGALVDLTHSAGGDSEYVATWLDGISSDIDLAFQSMIEGITPVQFFKPRRGLGLSLAKGA